MATLKPLTVIGLNSGTSMDGIDAAIFRIIPLGTQNKTNGHALSQNLDVEMLDALLHPIPPELTRKMRSMISAHSCSLDAIVRLNAALGEVFAQAAMAVMRQAGLSKRDVDLIGSHGQTIFHAPAMRKFAGIATHGTLQLGEPAIIAARTGVPVASNFRARDMATGGQGAPLVAFADEVLFGGEGEAVGVLNIGGIANITALDDHGEARMAFDTGPGNLLIDRACHKLFQRDFDEGGQLAAGGKVDNKWLEAILKHEYFQSQPPKTTGAELFGQAFADDLLREAEKRKLSAEDTLATITAVTAASVARAYKHFIQPEFPIATLILGGGGADNATLCKMLGEHWPGKLKLRRHEDFGVSTKFKEALLFALLAYTTHFGIPNNVPRCTGASQRVCLGTICRA
jgi:anhydro-N-acetylmuramic acid kinase